MTHNVKLLLVGCSGDETAKLTKDIYDILRNDYGLQEQVELLLTKRRDEVDPDTTKGHRSPLVADFFSDMEAQADIGRNQLKDFIRGKHVALVEHLLTPVRKLSGGQSVSVNDHIMTVRGLLDLFKGTETLHSTLAAPYSTYIRSHSVEDYERKGFHQFDSLRMTLKDFARDGLNTIITIDPHSDKAARLAEEVGLNYHGINPFRSGRAQNPYKLGLSGAQAEKTLKQLRPFQERFAKLVEENPGHVYIVAVDDGTEHRVENFVDRACPNMKPEEFYALIAYLDKSRGSYGGTETFFKRFSQVNASNIDREGIYVLIDDMFASGGTAMKAGQIFKDSGAKRVEAWMSHAVTVPHQYDKANVRAGIDTVVCIDTVPQSLDLNIEYIHASAPLLASELYKAHEKLVHERDAA